VEEPNSDEQIDQENPVGEKQELAQENKSESDINGITAKGEDAAGYKLVRVVSIDADTETPAKGSQAQKKQNQSSGAEKYADRGDDLRVKEFLPAYGGKTKCGGKDAIEIKEGERRNQKVFLVYIAEVDRFDPLAPHEYGTAPNHQNQK
jgi:hypothetical protein